MFRTFEHAGIQFMYPENWTLVDESGGEGEALVDVAVQSPGTCLWMLQVFRNGSSRQVLASEAIRSLQESYPDIEVVEAQSEVAGQEGIGFDVSFFCLDFLVQGAVRVFEIGDRIGTVVFQSEEREFADNEPVFAAITTSWLQCEAQSPLSSGD